ncbi:MAG: YkgJ family cysteine cluster protein [Armatimonadota bacterium]
MLDDVRFLFLFVPAYSLPRRKVDPGELPMTNQPTLARLPTFQCYDCQGCGDCCRGIFAIGLTAEERERIMAQGWESDPELQGQELFIAHGDRHLLAHREDGSCVFLDERGLCRIHAKFGEPAKPLACRLYPFKIIPVGSEVRTDIRYDCPAVAAGAGQPISGYRAALKELLPQVIPPEVYDQPPSPLYGNTRVSWPQLCRITDMFERLVRNRMLDLTRRVVACIYAAAVLRSVHLGELSDEKLREVLDAVQRKVIEATGEVELVRRSPGGMTRVTFRQLLGVYGREDRRGERGMLLRRLRASLRMVGGWGKVPQLRADFPDVPFKAMEEPLGIPPDDVVEPLERYLRMRLESMGFFGAGFYGYSYLDGLNALLLTYPLTFWFARAYAAGKGLVAPDRACIERGIQLVNHHHGITPVLALPTERFRLHYLCDRSTLRSLVIWYGS